jgi:hypothetical protein
VFHCVPYHFDISIDLTQRVRKHLWVVCISVLLPEIRPVKLGSAFLASPLGGSRQVPVTHSVSEQSATLERLGKQG